MKEKQPQSKTWTTVVLVLLVPVLPFIVIGGWLEPLVERGIESVVEQETWKSALVILSGLAVDIFLPIPSSVLLTFSGRIFGLVNGTLIGWVGLNGSAAIGYWASLRFGERFVTATSSPEAIGDVEQLGTHHRLGGCPLWWSLLVCRPLPILAEASVLLAGLERVPATRFWPPVLIGNFGLALAYAALGHRSGNSDWFTIAVVGAALVPLIFVAVRFGVRAARRKD